MGIERAAPAVAKPPRRKKKQQPPVSFARSFTASSIFHLLRPPVQPMDKVTIAISQRIKRGRKANPRFAKPGYHAFRAQEQQN